MYCGSVFFFIQLNLPESKTGSDRYSGRLQRRTCRNTQAVSPDSSLDPGRSSNLWIRVGYFVTRVRRLVRD